ncbi:pyridoxamine 5'-phosphate oxidase family protein [Arenibaculum pallidiluteum]|uniref:pyridoxamine 5'-phosphate oxidase family protein n=1 Tax=Arenibaculum pallidiluteum TaxID=2812559 RepID=UPI001A977484|nr:pyridoxamine 5'-phosphate oxidase family protein [Arenibaculum pallidiluteum]
MDVPYGEGPFHQGERRAQALAGGGPSGAAIRTFMPDQHRDFFALLPMILVGIPDADGWPVATMLTGPRGFVSSPDATTLHIAATPRPGDPAAGRIGPGSPVGLLGLDFATRRRNRANGTVMEADGAGFRVAVTQSFGNCPKYIQTRSLRETAAPGPGSEFGPGAGAVEPLSGLDAEAVALIRGADTFFVASGFVASGFVASGFAASGHSGATANGGMDVSHRGGRPGFVRVSGEDLLVPEFRGNRFYNTLGNLLADPRAGLLFVDFGTGDLLHLRGRVSTDWAPAPGLPTGAERFWRFETHGAIRRRAAIPLRWDLAEFSPATLATGIW